MNATKEERVDLLKRLRQWVDEQETWEAAPPLTEKQRSAILALVPRKHSPNTSDWVSEVNIYFQKRQLPSPSYKDEHVKDAPPDSPWRVWCVFHDGTRFPRLGFGGGEADQAPSFPSKKDAKQYAAHQAFCYIEGLQGNTSSKPRNFPAAQMTAPASKLEGLPSTPPVKRAKFTDEPPKSETVQNSSILDTPTANASAIFDALNRMSVSLGIPRPDIETEPDENHGQGFYKGRAIFAPWAKVPEGLGNKNGILGPKECKVQVAQEVLEWMEQEMKQREQLTEALINNKLK